MKHKTWFRLVIKAIGVLLIGLSASPLASAVIWTVRTMLFGDPWTMYTANSSVMTRGPISFAAILEQLINAIPPLLQMLTGWYLLFGGKWIVNRCIPSNHPYCPECGYDLSHSPHASQCPECGVALPASNAQ